MTYKALMIVTAIVTASTEFWIVAYCADKLWRPVNIIPVITLVVLVGISIIVGLAHMDSKND